MASAKRLYFTSVDGSKRVFTTEFIDYLIELHNRFTGRIHSLRKMRGQVLRRTLDLGQLPGHLPQSEINSSDWQVPEVPAELRKPGIEISGPASNARICINALNPLNGDERAEGYLDDDEDSATHRLTDTVQATINRLDAVEGTLSYFDTQRDKQYNLILGDLPFFMHRDRGLHLDEPDVTIDGASIPACTLGTALTLFHVGRKQIELGRGVYFYIPKLESADEAALYKDFFDFSRDYLALDKDAVIRAIILIESLPAVYQMEEMLHALGPYAAGLNAARWDLKASMFEFILSDANMVWPDRFAVDVKTTEFLSNIFRRLVAVCLKHNAVPIGGMATALPSRDSEVNEAASAAIRADKEWEASQGFLRGWVAHIFHMKTAADPFKDLRATGWHPTEKMANPDNYPVKIEAPKGHVTIEGTRRNARMLIEYLEGWMNGRGAKGIDSLEGKPGIHPALMEDLATGRMSTAQIAQRILHSSQDSETGQEHNFHLVKKLLQSEAEDILERRRTKAEHSGAEALAEFHASKIRYQKAVKIAMRWVKNYTEFNFKSLGSYTRADLEAIASADDAF